MTVKRSILSDEVSAAYFAPIELEKNPPRPHAAVVICENFKSFIKRAAEEGIDLEAESDKNLLIFYADEIERGDFMALRTPVRRKLKAQKLISRKWIDGRVVFSLTDRAKRLLEEDQLGVCSNEQNPTPQGRVSHSQEERI